MSGGNNEIPVQLDLEGGFVVGQPPQPSTNSRRDSDVDYDEYFNARHFGGGLQEYGMYDDGCYDDYYCDQDSPEGYYYESPSNDDSSVESQEQQSMESSPSKQDLMTLGPAKQTSKPQPTPRPIKTILGPPPTLLRTTTQVISSNLEKYHPHAFSIFSECQWESIIECRCESFAEVASSLHRSSKKLLLPPLSEKHLSLIENHPSNSHFRNSVKADRMLWKRIVDYSFPIGGMMRPAVLEEPWDVLVGRLVEWGKNLVELFEWKDENDGHGVEEARKRYHLGGNDDLLKSEDLEDSEEDGRISVQGEKSVAQQSDKDRLKAQSALRTKALHDLLKSIQCSPMDVKILSDTGVGKCVAKVIKIASKLMKSVKHHDLKADLEMEEAFAGYPYFWRKTCRLSREETSRSSTILKIVSYMEVNIPKMYSDDENTDVYLSPLQLLEQLLREWKKMASQSGVAISSTSTTTAATNAKSSSKKQKVDSTTALKCSPTLKEIERAYPFATFGKPINKSMEQHVSDLNLLRSSPNWRALYHTLRQREKMVRIAQGEKVRASRESLEKNRPKIGKVVHKQAVGRVRGLGTPAGSAKGQERREAILNKSLGKRAQAMQANGGSGSYNDSSTKSSGKLSQLRQESKVAAKWSKGTQQTVSKIAHNPGATFSSFGASVARAGGSNTTTAAASKPKMVGNQARVKLQGGKQMTLPSAASAKSIGMFSSLQKDIMGKKSAAERVAMKRESGKRKR